MLKISSYNTYYSDVFCGAYDRIFPAGTFAAYIYSGNQSVLIIEK